MTFLYTFQRNSNVAAAAAIAAMTATAATMKNTDGNSSKHLWLAPMQRILAKEYFNLMPHTKIIWHISNY